MSPCSPAGSSSSSLPDSNALLAIPDGPIPFESGDRRSHSISLIGGYPTFPPGLSVPDINCGVCHSPVALLAQVYCPPEEGENDRTVYVFACHKGGCQRRDGSVRAFRASRRNEEYVRDVEAKRAARERAEAEERARAKINPFSLSTDTPPNGGALFGGPALFGAPAQSNPFVAPVPVEIPDVSSLSITLDPSTTFGPPLPAYQPPQYLATIDEYLPPPGDVEMASDDEDETEEQKAEWRDERFEGLLPKGMDTVFERFVRRIETAEDGAKQVLRYELGGVPLPYAYASPLTRQLFPTLPRTKPDDDEPPYAEHYTPSIVPACSKCGGKRVFELQLVPSLISHLAPSTVSTTGDVPARKEEKAKSEEERKKELAKLAAGELDGGEGMEWGTIMVFGCQRDCVGLVEEWVGVEWEATLSS